MIRRSIATADALEKAVQQLIAIVGPDRVITERVGLRRYEDAYTPFFGEPELQLRPAAAVTPIDVAEIQAVVRAANELGISLYPVSKGQNLGYGGAAPTYSGSVIIDLSRLDRIIDVNEDDGTCLVEPGVSFLQLHRYFQARSLDFMVSTGEPGHGSVVANALEHGISVVRGDNFAAACGMEVVLPDGSLLRTGMGALNTPKLWQTHRYGYGPHIEGMFSQSNFGIITKMGFGLVPRPEAITSFSVASYRTDDLDHLIAQIQKLRQQDLIFWSSAGSPIRSATTRANGMLYHDMPEVDALLATTGGGRSAAWDELSRSKNIPAAIVTGAVRGPARVVDATLAHAREVFSCISGASFVETADFRLPLDSRPIPADAMPILGIPQDPGFDRVVRRSPNRGVFYFAPQIRASAEDMIEANRVLRKVIADSGDVEFLRNWGWQGGRGFQPRSYMIMVDFLIGDDAEKNRRRRDLFLRLVNAAADHGWGDYRSPAAFQSAVLDTYGFNDHALRRFLESLKDAIDPNGVLSPGKSGIWPKQLRSR